MANLTIDPKKVSPVYVVEQFTAPSGIAIANGVAVRVETTTGKLLKANAATAPNAAVKGISLSNATPAGMPTTVVRKGIVNVGDALDALAFGASVFLSDTDGLLADTAGTVSTKVGEVVAGFNADAGLSPDKLLRIDL